MSIYIENENKIINKLEKKISKWMEQIEYIWTTAYQVKIIKSEDQRKFKWETVEYFMHEKTFNKYKTVKVKSVKKQKKNIKKWIIFWMTNFEKWMYFLFNKDIR